MAGSLKNSETAEDSNGNPIQTVNNIGYKISLDGGTGWLSTAGVGTIRQDTTYKLNGERFWLASRYNGTNTMNENILQINTSASDDLEGVLYSKSFDDEYGWTMSSYSCEYGFCPVFKLNSNVIIKSGERNYGFSI